MASRSVSKRRRTETKDATEPVSSSTNTTKLRPVVVFAHGAGAPSSSEWMIRWRDKLENSLEAVEVITFDYPLMKALPSHLSDSLNNADELTNLILGDTNHGINLTDLSGGKRRAPPKAEKLIDYHSEVVNEASRKYPDHPLILAGKSMGSRVSCMVAACEDSGVSAVICLGYPLKGANGKVRDETLLQLRTPTMFVQGSKDGLSPLETLEAVRTKMECPNKLHVIEGGDHSFKIPKKQLELSGITQDEAEDLAAQAIAMFASQFL